MNATEKAQKINQQKLRLKEKCLHKAMDGHIDETWHEIDLSEFQRNNPNLISDLRKKYSV
jgi:hypothetical protein